MNYKLNRIWENVRQSVETFENRPDSGFLSKNFTRTFVYAWNYVIKGALGSSILFVYHLVSTIVSVGFSSALLLTVPVWAVAISLLQYLIETIIDFKNFKESGCLLAVILLYAGGSIAIAIELLLVLIVLPILSLVFMTGNFSRYLLRDLYDRFMWRFVIKPNAKVPVRDGFLVRRIKGPGLTSDYFFQISPSLALLALESHMEKQEMSAWKDEQRRNIQAPLDKLKSGISSILKALGGNDIDEKDAAIEHASMKTNKLLNQLNNVIEQQTKRLTIQGQIPTNAKDKIGQAFEDHVETMSKAPAIVQNFYCTRIFPKLVATETEKEKKREKIIKFWYDHQLVEDDWVGLSRKLFSALFTERFLEPLEETDKTFAIKIQHINATQFANMLIHGEPRDDLQRFSILPWKSKANLQLTVANLNLAVEFIEHPASIMELPQVARPLTSFQATSIKLRAPALNGHGILIAVAGRKANDFTFAQARVELSGEQFWNSVQSLPGGTLIGLLKGSFHPVELVNQFFIFFFLIRIFKFQRFDKDVFF